MSASRAGRNAEPFSCVFLILIRRSMISLLSIRTPSIVAAMPPCRRGVEKMAEVSAEVSAPLETPDRAREADDPHSRVVKFGADKPLRLDAGVELSPFQMAYQTYGALNPERSNAILVCHAL